MSSIDDITMTEISQQKDVRLVDVPINDENVALNIMVSFLSLAQRRGAFSFDEAAKIFECIKVFQKPL